MDAKERNQQYAATVADRIALQLGRETAARIEAQTLTEFLQARIRELEQANETALQGT